MLKPLLLLTAIAGTAAADAPARFFVPAATLERIARAELPAALEGRVYVIDVRYCGADAKGRGRALAALTVEPKERAAVLRRPDDCTAPLDGLAEKVRAASGEKAAAVAELAASARPKDLVFTLERLAVAGDAEALRALQAKPALPSVPTGALKLGNPGLTLSLGFEWRRDGVGLAAAPGAAIPAARGGPERAPEGGLAAELPLALINMLLARGLEREPLRIQIDPETVEVSEVKLARADSGLTATGKATPLTVGQTFDLAVDLQGSDLQITDVRAAAQLEDCTSLGILAKVGCDARNAGRRTAAQALAAGLRQHYRGRPARSLIPPQQLELPIAGHTRALKAEVQRLGARESSLQVEATVEPAP